MTVEYVLPVQEYESLTGLDSVLYVQKTTLIESKMRCDQVMLGISGGSSRALMGDIRRAAANIRPGRREWRFPISTGWSVKKAICSCQSMRYTQANKRQASVI